MTAYGTYGTSSYSVRELAGIVEERLGLAFEERDSDYRGAYLTTGRTAPTHIEIQPNSIPGDQGKDDLYLPEHPDIPLLLLAINSDRRPHAPPARTDLNTK